VHAFSDDDDDDNDDDGGGSMLFDPTELSSDPAALPPSGPERKRAGGGDDDCSGSSNKYNYTSGAVLKMIGFQSSFGSASGGNSDSRGGVPESKRHKGVAGGVPSAVLP
jgi:hypothetical protein